MLNFFRKLLRRDDARPRASNPGPKASRPVPRKPARPAQPAQPAKPRGKAPAGPGISHEAPGRIESIGPGKNVLVQNKYQREDTGTHETLKIVDDSLLEDDDEGGIDPYNTGKFDRSKNWDKRFRK